MENERNRKKKILQKAKEIKENRLMISFFNSFYAMDLDSDDDNTKKIDNQQVTRCVFELLAHFIREQEKINHKSNKTNLFKLRINVKSNICEKEVIERLCKFYNSSKLDIPDKLDKETKMILSNVDFVDVKIGKDKKHTVWSFDWNVSKETTRFFWIKDTYREGTWIDISVNTQDPSNNANTSTSGPVKSERTNDLRKQDNYSVTLNTGKCNFFRIMEIIFSNYEGKKLHQLIDEFRNVEVISNKIKETTKCALIISDNKKNDVREKIDDEIVCLKFAMDMLKEKSNSVIDTPYFYPIIDSSIVKDWVRQIGETSKIVKKMEKNSSNKNDSVIKELEEAADKLCFIPDIKKSSVTTDTKSKCKKRKREKMNTDNNSSNNVNEKRTGKNQEITAFIDKQKEFLKKNEKPGKKNTLSIALLSRNLANVYTGSHKVGQMISKVLSTKKRKLRIIGMNDVFFVDLLMHFSPLLIEEEKFIISKSREILKKNSSKCRLDENITEDYLRRIPSNLVMCSLRCFYANAIVSSDLFESTIIRNYNMDTNHKRMPVSKKSTKVKSSMNTINMKTVKKNLLKKKKISYDATRVGLPGGPPEWCNIIPIECEDKRNLEYIEEYRKMEEEKEICERNIKRRKTRIIDPKKNEIISINDIVENINKEKQILLDMEKVKKNVDEVISKKIYSVADLTKMLVLEIQKKINENKQ